MKAVLSISPFYLVRIVLSVALVARPFVASAVEFRKAELDQQALESLRELRSKTESNLSGLFVESKTGPRHKTYWDFDRAFTAPQCDIFVPLTETRGVTVPIRNYPSDLKIPREMWESVQEEAA
jgi:hypothetical protein